MLLNYGGHEVAIVSICYREYEGDKRLHFLVADSLKGEPGKRPGDEISPRWEFAEKVVADSVLLRNETGSYYPGSLFLVTWERE